MIRYSDMSKQHLLSIQACRKARAIMSGCLFISSIMQVFIEPSLLNISSVFTVLIISLITINLVLRAHIIRVMPFPTLVLIGYNISYLSGALIVESFFLQPLIFNLLAPEITFTYAALFQISLLISFFVFKNLNLLTISRKINTLIIKPMGLMQQPTDLQIWLIGLVGLISLVWSTTHTSTDDAIQYGDVGNKFLEGLRYLTYTPYFLEILNTFSSKQHQQSHLNRTTTRILLSIYTLVLLLLGTVLNARGLIIMGIANLGIAIMLIVLIGQLEVSKKILRRLAIISLLIFAISPILSDFSTTIVVVRSQRGKISNMEMIEQTISVFQDKNALENHRLTISALTNSGLYNEIYIPNPFLSRFIYTKFLDNTLSLKQNRSMRYALELWDVTLDKILALIPTPLIKTLNLNLDKNNLAYSFGDILYYFENGAGLGGFKVGSIIAHGIGLMGYLFFIVVIPLYILLFIGLQSFTIIGHKINLSLLIIVQLMTVFSYGVADSLVNVIAAILRTVPQTAIIFALIYKTLQLITPINKR